MRLLGIVAGVAIGVTLFLLLWGAFNGLHARDLRSAWVPPGGLPHRVTDEATNLGDDEVLTTITTDRFSGQTITRVDVATTPDSTVETPGIPGAPDPGTAYLSPALTALIASVPANQLGNRYGAPAGTIFDSALASPDSLMVINGRTVTELAEDSGTQVVTEFTGHAYGGSRNYQTVAIIGGISLLLPVLLLIGIVTDLGAAARRERFATLRLIGATPRTVAKIAATETAVTSLIGAILGVVIARALTPLAARLPIDGGSFFVSDLTVSPIEILIVILVTVAASTLVAGYRTLRAGIGPLGATRHQQEQMPGAARLGILLGGLGTMTATTLTGLAGIQLPRPDILLIVGFVATSVGLVVAGPYLTLLASRFATRRVSTAAGVIAMGRIRRTPRATFRSASGLVVAVFMVSVFAGAATTALQGSEVVDDEEHLPLTTLVGHLVLQPGHIAEAVASIEAVPGVERAAIGFYDPGFPDQLLFPKADAASFGFDQATDAEFVAVNTGYLSEEPASFVPAGGSDPGERTPTVILIATEGSPAAIEAARTAAGISALPFQDAPMTRAENAGTYLGTMESSFAALANLGILIATLIAAVSLAVATIAGILDRKRVLGLLRLMGMPVATLRRVIVYEAAIPLLTVSGLSIGLGFLAAWCINAGLTGGRRGIDWPDPGYLVILAASILFALSACTAAFGTARKSTGLTVTRYE